MSIIRTLTLLLIALGLASTQRVPAGVAAAVDTELIKNVKNYVMPMIINLVNNVAVPRIEFSGGHIDSINIDLGIKNNDSISLTFNQLVNGGILTAKDIDGVISGSIRYKILFISIGADVKVTFEPGAVTITSQLPLHSQMINGRNLPRVDIQNFDLSFDPNKIHIDLSGNVLADILDKLIWIIKSVVIKEIEKVVDSQVPPKLKDVINNRIIASNGFAPLIEGLSIDFAFTRDPIVTDVYLEAYANATVFDNVIGYKAPPTPVTEMEIDLTTRNQMIVDASTYSVDSLLLVMQDKNWFNYHLTPDTFNSEEVKKYLTTTYLDGLLPGIAAKYGKDVPVSLKFTSDKAPNSFFTTG